MQEEMDQRLALHQTELHQHHRITSSLMQDLCPASRALFEPRQADSTTKKVDPNTPSVGPRRAVE
jgi:hypothetical protein